MSTLFLSQLSAGRELVLGSDTSRLLVNYSWPGNVRELRNALQYAVAACSGKTIKPHHLPKTINQSTGLPGNLDLNGFLQRWAAAKVQGGATYKQLYAEMESTLLKYLMQHFDHKPSVLARELKMNRATLLKKRRHLGLNSEETQ